MDGVGTRFLQITTEVGEAYRVGRWIVDQLVGIHDEAPTTEAMPPEQQIDPSLFSHEMRFGGIEKDILT